MLFMPQLRPFYHLNLKNKVFAVGGGLGFNRGGMLTTASYKARQYGIRSGMSVAEALNLYPRLIVVPNRRNVYIKYSNIFYGTPKFIFLKPCLGSIDEVMSM